MTSTPRDPREREAAVLELTSLVKAIAHRIAARVPKHIEVDDLIGAGMIGLLDAVDKFDRAKSNNFKKYALVRVKGAMLDEIRAMDPMGRSLRRKVTHVTRTTDALERVLGRPPTEDEVASRLGIGLAGYRALRERLHPILVVSVEEMSDEGRDISSWITERSASDPAALLEAKRVREFLDRQILEIKERFGLVLRFYFYDGMTMREIAKVLDVSESRASQILTEALEAFGKRMRLAIGRHGSADVSLRRA